MSAPQKLTKKQKKAVAFRERKTGGKGKNAHVPDRMAAHELPELEVQDDADDARAPVEGAAVGPAKDGKGTEAGGEAAKKTKTAGVPKTVESGKKRKRAEDDDDVVGEAKQVEAAPKKKKKKAAEGGDKEKQKEASTSKQRFILFLGNLKYTTSLEAINAHFAACDPPPTVRLLTPKPTPGKPTAKSKGCAFLEFSHRNALQQALKLHQSQLDGRMINVELTAGGGGKSDTRLQKVKERNKGLHDQRKEKLEKDAKEGGSLVSTMARPQRYSTTSGVDQAPQKQRTWTVDDSMDPTTHRGGQKHRVRGSKKSSSSSSHPWGTGVNAIPVG